MTEVDGDTAHPAALLAAAEMGLASIHHPGDWVGSLHREADRHSAASIRTVGAALLRQGIDLSLQSPTDRDVFHSVARRHWNSMSVAQFDEVTREAWVGLSQNVQRFERQQGIFAAGPEQRLFPVRTSFKKWTNSWVENATRVVRKVYEHRPVPYDPRFADTDTAPMGKLLADGVANGWCLSPDMDALTRQAALRHSEMLSTIEQVFRTWLHSLTLNDANPREAVRAVVARMNHGLSPEAITKRISRDLGNIAFGVARMVARDGNLGRNPATDIALLAWRLLELEGVVQSVSEILADDGLSKDRRAARLAWLQDIALWISTLHDLDPEWRALAMPIVANAAHRLDDAVSRLDGTDSLMESVIIQTRALLNGWLGKQERSHED